MTNMDEEDRKYFDGHFNQLYTNQKETDKQVTKNSTDIGWLKKSHAAMAVVAGTLLSGLILWAVFGGG